MKKQLKEISRFGRNRFYGLLRLNWMINSAPPFHAFYEMKDFQISQNVCWFYLFAPSPPSQSRFSLARFLSIRPSSFRAASWLTFAIC